jgi:hypothetical protein
MHHLSFGVPEDKLHEYRQKLIDAGIEVSDIIRQTDHNGESISSFGGAARPARGRVHARARARGPGAPPPGRPTHRLTLRGTTCARAGAMRQPSLLAHGATVR